MRPMATLVMCLMGVSCTAWAQVPPTCPFQASELTAVFGTPFKEGKSVLEIPGNDTLTRDCRYEGKNFSVRVGTTVYSKVAPKPAEVQKMLAGKLVAIPGDPDGAVFQEGQGDASDPAVHYVRGAVAVQLRLMGIYYNSPASKTTDMRTMRDKLARLRRIP